MSSICRFIPAKQKSEGLETVYFVYETEFHGLKQPFFHATFYAFLVVRGNAELHVDGQSYSLRRGTLFIVPPSTKYTIVGDEQFTYMYISFTGERAFRLAEGHTVSSDAGVYHNFEWLIDFWQSAIRRVTRANANILSESVLLYTLSFMSEEENAFALPERSHTLYESMLAYLENHFTDADLSLRKIADIFSYTEKYLSHLFKKNMGINFNAYLTKMRMDYALQCIGAGVRNMSELAEACGYYDALYFSKVFKRVMGKTPLSYMRMAGK